jgi:hypothetical protein
MSSGLSGTPGMMWIGCGFHGFASATAGAAIRRASTTERIAKIVAPRRAARYDSRLPERYFFACFSFFFFCFSAVVSFCLFFLPCLTCPLAIGFASAFILNA